MQKNYKRIGDYIQLVDERNVGLKVKTLLGLSISKQFIPSVANIIGTDMENYKIIRKNQFACSTMQVRRDGKMPVALLKELDEAIISQAYPVFEVIDTTLLLPEYLMMWFSRSEFDREACFYAVGGVRGSLEWDDFLDMKLPIPIPSKQQEIVNEYHTITKRIKLNEELIIKLEETAQTIYKQWFVEFDFPNEKGKPYKSSGGEMVESELGLIPKGWNCNKLEEYVNLSQGLVINATTNHLIKDKGIPLLRITDLINDTFKIFIDESVPKKNIASKDDIIYTRTGQVGLVFRNKEGVVYNNCFKVFPKNERINKDYIFWFLKQKNTFNLMVELAAGSAQSDLNHSAFLIVNIIEPDEFVQLEFSKIIVPLEKNIYYKQRESNLLMNMETILLSKMATI